MAKKNVVYVIWRYEQVKPYKAQVSEQHKLVIPDFIVNAGLKEVYVNRFAENCAQDLRKEGNINISIETSTKAQKLSAKRWH